MDINVETFEAEYLSPYELRNPKEVFYIQFYRTIKYINENLIQGERKFVFKLKVANAIKQLYEKHGWKVIIHKNTDSLETVAVTVIFEENNNE